MLGTQLRPHNNMMNMKREMDRLFGDWSDQAPTETTGWRPAVDIIEDENGLSLNVEIPGIKKEDVKINIENDVLSISGERKLEGEEKEGSYRRIERNYGSFYRSFSLSNKVDTGKIEASYADGLLSITMPKREEAKPRQIEVKVN
jgi:HSP20 family protein